MGDLLGYLSDRDSERLARAMTLLSYDRDVLHRFHVEGVKYDTAGESSATDALVKARYLVGPDREASPSGLRRSYINSGACW